MSEKYTGQAEDRRYESADVDITYSLKRCIHAKVCVNRLSEVFDIEKRPWINADGAPAERVAQVIDNCPSGALHYERKDDGESETIPQMNRVVLQKDGYLHFHGNLNIQSAHTNITDETRATLCRCGDSDNKPFCDNTHKKMNFQTGTPDAGEIEGEIATGGKLNITAYPNGPYGIAGNFQIEDETGQVIFAGKKAVLCRCGQSSNKPFCDGTHTTIKFSAE